MRYQVRFVGDDQLPSEVEFVFVCLRGRTHLLVKRSTVDAATGRCAALTRAWSTWERASVELEELAHSL